ncbi:MAG TPA: helix-turn-helix domain-containing protein [Planctomycetota bacterium]|nr:helix-turn-helix domain-containing protein [Planctomycetota bacterium]
MRPGPAKQFDPQAALEQARDLFWRRGYDGTGMAELETELGIGRKSLYDTFGNKRALYLAALEQYGASVIETICAGVERVGTPAFDNLERVLTKLARHHGSGESLGCLLGVGLGQIERGDGELGELLRRWLSRLERAFEGTLERAAAEGALREGVRPRDAARQLVALVQGLALLGRVARTPAAHIGAVRSALAGLRA